MVNLPPVTRLYIMLAWIIARPFLSQCRGCSISFEDRIREFVMVWNHMSKSKLAKLVDLIMVLFPIPNPPIHFVHSFKCHYNKSNSRLTKYAHPLPDKNYGLVWSMMLQVSNLYAYDTLGLLWPNARLYVFQGRLSQQIRTATASRS